MVLGAVFAQAEPSAVARLQGREGEGDAAFAATADAGADDARREALEAA